MDVYVFIIPVSRRCPLERHEAPRVQHVGTCMRLQRLSARFRQVGRGLNPNRLPPRPAARLNGCGSTDVRGRTVGRGLGPNVSVLTVVRSIEVTPRPLI